MRYYANASQVFSEVLRDCDEMGIITRPKSYQDKIIEGKDEFTTKELIMYHYVLTDLPDPENLFLFEGQNARSWADAEFQERVNPQQINPGAAWKIREDVWTEFLVDGERFHYTYNNRLIMSLPLIQAELIRNPDTRQAWAPIFRPQDLRNVGGKERIPCSLGYFFMVREGILHMSYIQRSGDIVKHWGNDIYLAWRMKEWMAKQTGYKPGYLYHTTFSLHSYKRDWDKLKAGISKLVAR